MHHNVVSWLHPVQMRLLDSDGGDAGAISDVGNRLVLESGRDAETARAGSLVADGEVEVAELVNAPGAGRVLDVVESVVLGDEAVGLGQAGSKVVHAVGGREREFAVVLEEETALAGGDGLPLHGDGATLAGSLSGALAGAEVVPGVVGDVVGTAGLVDAEQVDVALAVGDLDADVVAADGVGPVGDAVGVDLAAKNAD